MSREAPTCDYEQTFQYNAPVALPPPSVYGTYESKVLQGSAVTPLEEVVNIGKQPNNTDGIYEEGTEGTCSFTFEPVGVPESATNRAARISHRFLASAQGTLPLDPVLMGCSLCGGCCCVRVATVVLVVGRRGLVALFSVSCRSSAPTSQSILLPKTRPVTTNTCPRKLLPEFFSTF